MSRWLQANYKRKAKVQTMEELIKVLDDELFIEVCESFEEAELSELQHQLDKYQ